MTCKDLGKAIELLLHGLSIDEVADNHDVDIRALSLVIKEITTNDRINNELIVKQIKITEKGDNKEYQ